MKVEPANFFLIRTPRLGLEVVSAVHDADEASLHLLTKALLSADTQIGTALHLASSDFHSELADQLGREARLPRKLAVTLYKYLLRMASRATPFGLFSSVSHGRIAPVATNIQIGGKPISRTRVDMGVSLRFRDMLLSDPSIHPLLMFFPNDTIHVRDDHYQFFENRDCEGKQECHWVRVERNPLLNAVVERAQGGANYNALVETVTSFQIPEDRAKDFVMKLTAGQLLYTNLEPAITGGNHFDTILGLLEQAAPTLGDLSRYTRYLSLKRSVEQINSQNLVGLDSMLSIQLAIGAEHDGHALQADAYSSMVSCTLGRDISETIVREIAELNALCHRQDPRSLREFRRRFHERYGDEEVPLLEALDIDRGVGYGNPDTPYLPDNPLLDGLDISLRGADESRTVMDEIIRIRRLHNVVGNQYTLNLTQEDLRSIGPVDSGKDMADQGCYVMGNLLKDNPVNNFGVHNFRFNVLACGGPSSIPLMTRFAHLSGRLGESLIEMARIEEQLHPDDVMAEVVHIPGKRIANVLQRPNLLRYEIPVLGRSAVPEEYQIALSDLMVSVSGGEVILRSKRLGKRVRPRLNSAHNYKSGMSVYRFLCDIQRQGAYQLFWDWGKREEYRTFFPRVCYKHLILSRAQWWIPSRAYREVKSLPHDEAVANLRQRYGLPELVTLTEGDHEIPLDLTKAISREIMLRALRTKGAMLHEVLYPEFESPVSDTHGKLYHNEIIVPFILRGQSRATIKPKPRVPRSFARIFPPGSEWVYFKLYCGQKEADRILVKYLPSFLSRVRETLHLKKWFFIRYRDPGSHLRIRFHLEDPSEALCLMDLINEEFGCLVTSGVAQAIQYDTYRREVERYGGSAVELCESIFHRHSELMLEVAPRLFKHTQGQKRWMFALQGVDRLLDVFDFSVRERLGMVSEWRSSMFLENARPDELKRMLDIRYRDMKDDIWGCLVDRSEKTANLGDWESWQSSMGPLADRIKTVLADDGAWESVIKRDLVFSLSHMNLNRLFYSNQRENELVIYHLLAKFYQSNMKRMEQFAYKDDMRLPKLVHPLHTRVG